MEDIAITNIWMPTKGVLYVDEAINGMVESVKKHGQVTPILVEEDPCDGRRYKLLDGGVRLLACARLGYRDVIAEVRPKDDLCAQFGWYGVRTMTDPIEYALKLKKAYDASSDSIKDFADRVNMIPDQVKHYLRIAESHLAEVKKAEEHGKLEARRAQAQDERERTILGRVPCTGKGCYYQHEQQLSRHTSDCKVSEAFAVKHGVRLDYVNVADEESYRRRWGIPTTVAGDSKVPLNLTQDEFTRRYLAGKPHGLGAKCVHDGCERPSTFATGKCAHHMSARRPSPKERGLVLCLEPGCRTWIKPGREDAHGQVHFCRKHRKKTYEAHPLRDRDGDPIWVGAKFQVMKMQDMEMSHLLNCITMLERAAEKRADISSPSTSAGERRKLVAGFLAESPRYKFLLDEVKQRDACKACRGGIVELVVEDHVFASFDAVVKHCDCPKGQERSIAAQVAEQARGRDKTAILVLAMAFITTLLNLPAASDAVMQVAAAVHERLRAMGVL